MPSAIVAGAHHIAVGRWAEIAPSAAASVTRQRKAPRRLPGTLGGGSGLRTLGTRSQKGDFRFGERDRRGADKRGSETVSM